MLTSLLNKMKQQDGKFGSSDKLKQLVGQFLYIVSAMVTVFYCTFTVADLGGWPPFLPSQEI